ncbi:somatostatin [Athene cunicularia]|uniref:somatostatin n=1 Tax=Athene cunicularia TaxID=194338 RepID=UPI000EF715FC|nr:somatostatin [Athene cunicularia]
MKGAVRAWRDTRRNSPQWEGDPNQPLLRVPPKTLPVALEQQPHSILAESSAELAKYFLAELLSEPSQTENEALESEDLSRGAEQDEVRLELERSANSNPALAPRERKAGCKNFFWKTFTSC